MDRGAWWATEPDTTEETWRACSFILMSFSVPRSHSGCGVTFPQLRLLYTGAAFWSFLVSDAPDRLRITGQTCC